MGFVPAKADSVVVLLCRVCVEGAPGLKVRQVAGFKLRTLPVGPLGAFALHAARKTSAVCGV